MLDSPEEQARRQGALERIRRIQAECLARNQDLTPEQGDELANQFSHEMIEDLVREGKIVFEPQSEEVLANNQDSFDPAAVRNRLAIWMGRFSPHTDTPQTP